MTPQDVIDRLFTVKGITTERIKKAQGFASRNNLGWADVLNAMTDEQRTWISQVQARG